MTLLQAIQKTLNIHVINRGDMAEIEAEWREGMDLVLWAEPADGWWAAPLASNTGEAALDMLDEIAQDCWGEDWPRDDPEYLAIRVDLHGDAVQLTGEPRIHGVVSIGIASGF